MAKGTPSPFWGRATVRLPSSKFFIFFLPYPIISPIYPFFLLLRGFLFLCVYLPIRVSFCVSEGKIQGNKNCFSCPICVYVVIMRSILILYSHSLLFFPPVFPLLFSSPCYVLVLSFVVAVVFFADLPILLPSVGFSPLLCVIIRLGIFRGSEAKK